MRCTVVIPCHNGADLTRLCIASLLQQQGGAPAEILLVDNGSTDATPELGALGAPVRVLRQGRNLGFAGGVNAGIRAATQPLVLVLNNDTQAAPDLLFVLAGALASDARLGAVAPVSNYVKGAARVPVGDAGRTHEGRIAIATALRAGPPLQDADSLAGLCLLVTRTTFAEIGWFDERFGHGNFEDDDFSLRLRLHGHRLGIARHAFLHHEGHATFRAMGIQLGDELAHRRRQFVAKWRHDPAGAATIAGMHGDLEAGAAGARAARTRWPLWPDADWHLGQWHAARGEHDLALAHFRALLDACPQHVEAMLAAGCCHLARGDAAAAQGALLGATRFPLPPQQQAWLHERLGAHAGAVGSWQQAHDHFAAALQLAPAADALRAKLDVCRRAIARAGYESLAPTR